MCGEKESSRIFFIAFMGSPPRVRGEVDDVALQRALGGSPPRVRGEVDSAVVSPPISRITPACAGRSAGVGRPPHQQQDHPRVCGEKLQLLHGFSQTEGSPPRVRGEARQVQRYSVQTGDHPRVCGEKQACPWYTGHGRGSPPRVRGEVFDFAFRVVVCGITPACAGRSRRPHIGRAGAQDHPRVCGEKPCCSRIFSTRQGSPPRVRGEGHTSGTARPSGRITPACAGRSFRPLESGGGDEDHPRVCGEKNLVDSNGDLPEGSPPRVRGEGHVCGKGGAAVGITPACAGRSACLTPRYRRPPDHPRGCGEKTIRLMILTSGSPPRVRGEARISAISERESWITPACAGRRPLPA